MGVKHTILWCFVAVSLQNQLKHSKLVGEIRYDTPYMSWFHCRGWYHFFLFSNVLMVTCHWLGTLHMKVIILTGGGKFNTNIRKAADIDDFVHIRTHGALSKNKLTVTKQPGSCQNSDISQAVCVIAASNIHVGKWIDKTWSSYSSLCYYAIMPDGLSVINARPFAKTTLIFVGRRVWVINYKLLTESSISTAHWANPQQMEVGEEPAEGYKKISWRALPPLQSCSLMAVYIITLFHW